MRHSVALGYSRAHAAASETAKLERHGEGLIRRLTRGLRIVFGMKYGGLLRLLMPMILLAFVAVPLSDALAHVTWQLGVRASIQRILGTLPENTVRSTFSVERNDVTVQLIAVADSSALENITAKLETARPAAPAMAKAASIDNTRLELHEVLMDAWPSSAGKLLETRVVFPREAPIVVEVVHLGPQLGGAGEELLGERISRALGSEVGIRDVAISADSLTKARGEGPAFLRASWPLLEHIDHVPGLRACVEYPKERTPNVAKGKSRIELKPTKETNSQITADSVIVELLRMSFAKNPDRIGWSAGNDWRLVMTTEPCVVPPSSDLAATKAGTTSP